MLCFAAFLVMPWLQDSLPISGRFLHRSSRSSWTQYSWTQYTWFHQAFCCSELCHFGRSPSDSMPVEPESFPRSICISRDWPPIVQRLHPFMCPDLFPVQNLPLKWLEKLPVTINFVFDQVEFPAETPYPGMLIACGTSSRRKSFNSASALERVCTWRNTVASSITLVSILTGWRYWCNPFPGFWSFLDCMCRSSKHGLKYQNGNWLNDYYMND